MGQVHYAQGSGGRMYFTGNVTPSERALARQWNASNATQRAAIKQFLGLTPDQQMGLIQSSGAWANRHQ